MLNLFCAIASLFMVVLMFWMIVTTLLQVQIYRNLPPRYSHPKQNVPVQTGDAPPEPEPIPVEPMDMDAGLENLWIVLNDQGIYVTQWEHIVMMFGRDNFHQFVCHNGQALVWYGKQPEPVRLAIQADQKLRKAAKQQQKGVA